MFLIGKGILVGSDGFFLFLSNMCQRMFSFSLWVTRECLFEAGFIGLVQRFHCAKKKKKKRGDFDAQICL
jgi:hypothetical protein